MTAQPTAQPVSSPRNGAARLGFGLWLASIAILVLAIVVAIIVAAAGRGDDAAAASIIIYPFIASFAYCPLLLIGTIASAAGIARKGQPKILAVVGLLLNGACFLLSTVVFLTAVAYVTS